MTKDESLEVSISPTLYSMARRFDIDLSALADETLTERILRDPVRALTARMRTALMAAQEVAREYGHKHIGTEHVFLAILLDEYALPTQLMNNANALDEITSQIRGMLASDSYNRRSVSTDQGERAQDAPPS